MIMYRTHEGQTKVLIMWWWGRGGGGPDEIRHAVGTEWSSYDSGVVVRALSQQRTKRSRVASDNRQPFGFS